MIPANKILSLSLNEAVAEKLEAAITRRDSVIRDYYDLWYIAETNFDFCSKPFINIFKKKLEYENYNGNWQYNFGLDESAIELLYHQVETDLMPVIRVGENFDLKKVFTRFNKILRGIG